MNGPASGTQEESTSTLERLMEQPQNSNWHHAEHTQNYGQYPTVRHRWRFILDTLKQRGIRQDTTVFDFGCGDGTLLKNIRDTFGIPETQMSGCDISADAVELASQKFRASTFFLSSMPEIHQQFSVIICSEVIEHTTAYREILRWISDHLSTGGSLVLTTQSGHRHTSDLLYAKHTQHFALHELETLLQDLHMKILLKRQWGFPFFTLQKWLTNFRFTAVRDRYLRGRRTLRKRIVFATAYALYFVHDWINAGPQIFLVAEKID